jgi:dihydroorotate dehydrogenase (NAD+) catalytic subunit
MAQDRLTVDLGPLRLRTPLVAASGTVGAVWEWAQVADTRVFGAAVAKSVSPEPWTGRPAPRVAPLRTGMINGIGIQNPGIDAWVEENGSRIRSLEVPVWGSAVGNTADGYATVARGLEGAGVAAVEINLSCPNLDDGEMFSFDADRSAGVVAAVKRAVTVPVGAKLSPNTPDVVGVARACVEAGAAFLTLTNTAFGFAVDPVSRRPLITGGVGGYSGPGIKPVALRAVYEVSQDMAGVPIVGCGGVMTGADVVEYLVAGASAVAMGTALMEDPKAGTRVLRELEKELDRLGVARAADLTGTVRRW